MNGGAFSPPVFIWGLIMAKKSKSVRDALDNAKDLVGRNSQIDMWLSKKNGREGELLEAISGFFENRDSHFGWEAFHKALIGFEGWGEFPVGVRGLQSYVARHGLDTGADIAD